MSYEDYWNGSPYLAVYYYKKHLLEIERQNQAMWLQGLYFYNAVGSVIASAFSKNKKIEYCKEPIEIVPKTTEEKEMKARITREKTIAQLNSWKSMWEKRNNKSEVR